VSFNCFPNSTSTPSWKLVFVSVYSGERVKLIWTVRLETLVRNTEDVFLCTMCVCVCKTCLYQKFLHLVLRSKTPCSVLDWNVSCFYTRVRQAKWPPGWKIHRPGSTLPSPAYCFASVCWQPVFWGRRLKMASTLGIKCIRVTWLEDFLTLKWSGRFAAVVLPLWDCKRENDGMWKWIFAVMSVSVSKYNQIICRRHLFIVHWKNYVYSLTVTCFTGRGCCCTRFCQGLGLCHTSFCL